MCMYWNISAAYGYAFEFCTNEKMDISSHMPDIDSLMSPTKVLGLYTNGTTRLGTEET